MSTSMYSKHISMNCIMSNLIGFLAKLACCSLIIGSYLRPKTQEHPSPSSNMFDFRSSS